MKMTPKTKTTLKKQRQPEKWRFPKNEYDLKYEENLKNQDYLKKEYEGDLNNEDNSQNGGIKH